MARFNQSKVRGVSGEAGCNDSATGNPVVNRPHASERNALGARCGALAYLPGFSNCIDLTYV